MRILEPGTRVVDNSLILDKSNGQGCRIISRGGIGVCDDGDATLVRAAELAMAAKNLHNKTVAWIGGGFCVGPRVFGVARCTQTVYELESALSEFCPGSCTFIPGDWRTTITGSYDVIVYDLGGDVPREELTPFLAAGGIILPAE